MQIYQVKSHTLFVTHLFRQSPWIAELWKAVPFVWVTDEPLTFGHFGTYFGVTERRATYTNKFIQDLYWLHELTHARLRKYDPKQRRTKWIEAMFKEELEASLTSECFVYARIPGLREHTFPEIWMDRFLTNAVGSKHLEPPYLNDVEAAVRRERIRALTSPIPWDNHERQIHGYGQDNHEWYRIWTKPTGIERFGDKPAFRVVEEHMSRPDWSDCHREWIDSVTAGRTMARPGGMPFNVQADLFKPVYDRSGEEFGNRFNDL